MSVWHGDLHKRKPSGGKRRVCRKKRKFEQGSFPIRTILGEPKRKIERTMGGNVKVKILSERNACVTDPKSGITKKVEILRVVKNPANVDYDRRGVMTKGTIIETPLGIARITSRPGQNGTINAILIKETEI